MLKLSDLASLNHMKSTPGLYISDNPLVLSKLSRLRDIECPLGEFQRSLEDIGVALFIEAARGLAVEKRVVKTPMEEMEGVAVKKEIVLVPILRAGLSMLKAIREFVPAAKVGMLGMARNEETLLPYSYLERLPADLDKAHVFIIDPMLATGGSAVNAVQRLKDTGANDISLVSLIAAPEGIENVKTKFPELPLYLAAVDRCLDHRGFILPGLGDAGDRYFGT